MGRLISSLLFSRDPSRAQEIYDFTYLYNGHFFFHIKEERGTNQKPLFIRNTVISYYILNLIPLELELL